MALFQIFIVLSFLALQTLVELNLDALKELEQTETRKVCQGKEVTPKVPQKAQEAQKAHQEAQEAQEAHQEEEKQDLAHNLEHMLINCETSRELLKSLQNALFCLGYNFDNCSVSKIFLNCNERGKEMYTLKDFTKRLKGPNAKTLRLIYETLDNDGLLSNTNFTFQD